MNILAALIVRLNSYYAFASNNAYWERRLAASKDRPGQIFMGHMRHKETGEMRDHNGYPLLANGQTDYGWQGWKDQPAGWQYALHTDPMWEKSEQNMQADWAWCPCKPLPPYQQWGGEGREVRMEPDTHTEATIICQKHESKMIVINQIVQNPQKIIDIISGLDPHKALDFGLCRGEGGEVSFVIQNLTGLSAALLRDMHLPDTAQLIWGFREVLQATHPDITVLSVSC